MKRGLVLSGGGVRGLAHVGLIEVLNREGIDFEEVSGTSAGAIVASLYAAGYDSQTMLELFLETPFFQFSRIAGFKPGFLDMEKFVPDMKKIFPEDNFQHLSKRLHITMTNLQTGRLKIVSDGPLIHAVLASAAHPMIFTPVVIEDELYGDGGILNNFPIEPLRWSCDQILGSFVNPLQPITKKDLNSTLKVYQRTFEIAVDGPSYYKFGHCQFVFQPMVTMYNLFDFRKIKEIYELGKKEAELVLPDIIAALQIKNS